MKLAAVDNFELSTAADLCFSPPRAAATLDGMTTSSEPDLRLRTPTDVLGAVPYLLGFHPVDSVVLLGMRARRLVFHARADLPAADASAREILAVATDLATLFAARGIESVLVVGYGAVERATSMLTELERAMGHRGVLVVEMLRTVDGRYWSYLCDRPDCCPPDGVAYDVSESEVAALATLAGCVALPDRETVVRSLDPPVGAALTAIAEATDRAGDRLLGLLTGEHGSASVEAAGSALVAEAFLRYGAGGRLTDDELAWLTMLLTLNQVRDATWQRIDADGPDDLETHGRLWSDVLRRCDPTMAAPPGLLLAYTMWQAGDGVRAAVAVERALTADPGYEGARLMAEVISRGLPPPSSGQPRVGPTPAPHPRPARRPHRRRAAHRRRR